MEIKTLKSGGNCIVHRPEESFFGHVKELRDGWAKVSGKGSVAGTIFDEWFPISSEKVSVSAR